MVLQMPIIQNKWLDDYRTINTSVFIPICSRANGRIISWDEKGGFCISASVGRSPKHPGAESSLFTVRPRGAVEINWDERIVRGMTLSLFTRFFLRTHLIRHTHLERRMLSL